MAKMGRPPVEEPSNHKVSVRLTDKQYQRLKAYAESCNESMTEALKKGMELLLENSER